MGQYEYDENGSIFYYFVVSILALILIPATYSALVVTPSPIAKHTEGVPACPCKQCAIKATTVAKAKAARKAGVLSTKNILLILGWIAFAFVSYKVATTELAETGLWDPYEILGLTTSATESEIKKKFRKLSLQFHPDKVTGTEAEKEAAAQIYNDLSKAQKVLTDAEARATFDEFGHPDGRQALSLGIALPKYLIDAQNNVLVLFLYGSIFGILMPIFVARWWYSSKNMNNDKIRHETMGKLYKELKVDTNAKAMLDIVCTADEMIDAVTYDKSERVKLEELAMLVAQEAGKAGYVFEAKKKYATVGEAVTHKIQILLYAHLTRLPISDVKLAAEQSAIAELAPMVIVGILQICASRFWLSTAMVAIDLRQAVIQAVLPSRGPLGQVPYVSLELLKGFVGGKHRVTCPRELIELPESESRELLKSLSKEQGDEMLAIAKQYPLVRVSKCNFSVIGEEFITPSAIVTLSVTLSHITPAEALHNKQHGAPPIDVTPPPVTHAEKPAQWFKPAPKNLLPIHCPYYPKEVTSTWWILMGSPETNRLISLSKVKDAGPPGVGEPQTVKLQFQAPPQPGTWTFHVYVKSDGAMGCDLDVEMTLVVVDVPEVSRAIVEEEMSEPEEDSIAGQMAMLKGEVSAGGGGGGGGAGRVREELEDSSDSDSD
ncbi:secretory subunit [Podochytrium sp. JEL0797]|nr:secretory subunit [Podochytrium sp. JEL0797]